MSATTFCEACGRDSASPSTCEHCGRALDPSPDVVVPPSVYGRIRLRLHPETPRSLWSELGQYWDAFEVTLFHLPEQRQSFRTDADQIEVFGTDFHSQRLGEILADRGSAEFEALPREALPWEEPPPGTSLDSWAQARARERSRRQRAGK